MPELIVDHTSTLTEAERATVARQLTLSSIAQDIANDLVEAYEFSGGQAGFITRRLLKLQAERAVMRTQPSAHENALGAAHRAQRETLLIMLETVARSPKYADHSSADLVRRALTELAGMLDRVGPSYVLAAYEGALEAIR